MRSVRYLILLWLLPVQGLLAEVSPAVLSKRIVSFDVCLDQLLLQLVEPERIASLSYLVADSRLSLAADAVSGIHLNHGQAEEIIPLQPDLILAGRYGAQKAVGLLSRLGYPVKRFDLPRSIRQVREFILSVGNAVGAQERANILVSKFDASLEELNQSQLENTMRQQPKALYLGPNAMTMGKGTLEHDVIEAAGYRNLAAEKSITGVAALNLETIVAWQPEYLLVSSVGGEQYALANEILEHKVLKKMIPSQKRIQLPAASLTCAGPQLPEFINWLASQK